LLFALALTVWAHHIGWAEEPAGMPADGGRVQERGIISPAIKGLTPAEPSPGEELKDLTILRGFKRYWIDRLELTPPEFVMGQTLERARVWYHCRPACLNADRVTGAAIEIHYWCEPDPGMLIAIRLLSNQRDEVAVLREVPCQTPGTSLCQSHAPSNRQPAYVKSRLSDEQDRINRAFPIVPVGDDRRFRAGGSSRGDLEGDMTLA
jgi:hypothetical protein